MNGYILCIWLHVLAACVWIGSMVFFAAVVVPTLRHHAIRSSAATLMGVMGPKFRAVGMLSLAALIVTGVIQLGYRGIGWSEIRSAALWSSDWGRTLAHKLSLVALVVAATIAHEFITRGDPVRYRRAASWIGRLMMIASVAILYFAVRLSRGL